MDARELLNTLQEQGFIVKPLPDGKLEIQPASKLRDELRQAIKARKAEVLALLTPPSLPWPCFKCGRPAEIEAVEPSLDGERMLTFWHCEPCQSYAVTPSTVKEPPQGWATKTRQ